MANISHSARKRPILVLPGRGHGSEDSGEEEETVRRWVVVLVLCVDTYEREESFVTSPPTRHPPALSPPPIIPARAKSKLSRLRSLSSAPSLPSRAGGRLCKTPSLLVPSNSRPGSNLSSRVSEKLGGRVCYQVWMSWMSWIPGHPGAA
jgi:hypothetical protein